MKKHLPNILTLANLMTGCVGIVNALSGNLVYAAYAIWLAAIFDFFDGFTARLLQVSSPIGKELDSLADMVTFGALPAFMLFNLANAANYELLNFNYITFSLALFSALRLAKFNIDNRQSTSFIGLPTPAAAFFVSGMPFWVNRYPELGQWQFIIVVALVLSLLLVSPIKMLALKFKDYSITNNWQKYLLLLLSIILIALLYARSLPIIISIYLLISLFSLRTK